MIASTSEKQLIQETIENNEELIKGKKIIIFGCTMYARDIRDAVVNQGENIFCIIDNNPDKAGRDKYCLGVPVIFPKELDVTDTDIRIIICSKYAIEMISQLDEIGINKEQILRIKVDEDKNVYEDSIEELYVTVSEVKKGLSIYQSIILDKEYERVFICPYPGTGDIYVACSLLKRYLKENNVLEYVVVLSTKACEKVARLFIGDRTILLSSTELEEVLKYWEFAGDTTIIKPLLYWGWRTKRYLFADKYPQISFSKMFIADVYGFDEPVQFDKPDQSNLEISRKDFLEKGLIIGKTVLLAPYAGSFVSELKSEFWEQLVTILKNYGYCVCTNSSGINEPAIKGTIPIFVSYDQIINFMDLAGYFIGIRSGLCDVISSSNCKKVILYEDNFNATKMSFFGLKKMGLCDDAYEINCESKEGMEQLVEKIVLLIN